METETSHAPELSHEALKSAFERKAHKSSQPELSGLPKAALDLFLESLPKEAPREAAILDLGCGSGRDSFYLLHHGHAVTALDFSASALRHTQTLCDSAPHPFPLIIREEDAAFSQFKEGSLKGIWAHQFFSYVSATVCRRVLLSLFKASVPGAPLFASLPGETSSFSDIPFHRHDPEEFAYLLHQCGFRVLKRATAPAEIGFFTQRG